MTVTNLAETNKKYFDYAQCNINFLSRVSKQRRESQYIDVAQMKKKISSVTAKLKTLSQAEINQWKEIHMMKLRELASALKCKSQNTNGFTKQSKSHELSSTLREQLLLIVESCKIMKIEYNSGEVAQIIQQFYFKEYKDDILQIMEDAGYNTNPFKVLYYQQPSFFSFCCCWQPSLR